MICEDNISILNIDTLEEEDKKEKKIKKYIVSTLA